MAIPQNPSMATPITTQSCVVEVTPTLDTSIYASGDRLGSIMEITNAARDPGFAVTLCDVVVVDKAKQSVAIDILFFRDLPTVASADNAAIDISDSEMASKFIGRVSVATTDYTALANNSEASPAPFNRVFQTLQASTSIWALAVCRSGTPTYGANDLTFKFKFFQD